MFVKVLTITYTKRGVMSMYSGDNKTAVTSQQLISDAMLTMLKEKPFSEISISDLCKEAQVSRQTFYSLFGKKENVIAYVLKCRCCYQPEDNNKSCRSAVFRDFCRGYSDYIISRKHILELLVRNDMMHFLYDVQYESFMECDHFVRETTGEDRTYLVDFIASGMNSIAKNYVLMGCHDDRERLEQIMYRLFGGMYFTEKKKEWTV